MKNYFDKAVDSLGRLFGQAEPEPKKVQKTKAQNRRKSPAGSPAKINLTRSMAEIEKALTKLDKAGRVPVAGRVQVLNFDKLKVELGKDWERIGGKIEQVIESAIRQFLSPQDLHWKLGEHAYVLLFPTLVLAEAEAKCALIRAKVEEYFNGNEKLIGKLEISTAVASTDGNIQLKAVDDLETILAKLKLSRTSKPAIKATSQSNGPGQAPTDIAPPHIEEAAEEPDQKWRAMTDDIDTARNKVATFEFTCLPLWDTTHKSILSWAMMPNNPEENGRIYGGSSILRAWSGGAMTLALDEKSLRHLQTEASLPDGKASWVQAHYGTLNEPSMQRQFIGALSKINEGLLSETTLEVVGLPQKISVLALNDSVQFLANRFKHVAMCCNLSSPQINEQTSGLARWVGFDMRSYDGPSEEVTDMISAFVKRAEAHHLKVYARNLPNYEIAMSAIAMGVRYVFAIETGHGSSGEASEFNMETLFEAEGQH